MTVEIIAIFIPILFVIGLFTAITLNIYYKYKTNTKMSEKVPLESLGEWYKTEARTKVLRSRGAAIRWGGFFAGLGIGVAAGIFIINIDNWQDDIHSFFLTAGLALFCAGAGMIGAYFLERGLDKKTECE